MRLRVDSRYNPVGGFQDFWDEFRKPNPYRWPVLLVSMTITGSLVYVFGQERVYVPPERPNVTYITSFEPGRTDAEIQQSNQENQRNQDAIRALEERQIERRRELYRQLGRATGVDVDAMEAEIEAERSAEATTDRADPASPTAP